MAGSDAFLWEFIGTTLLLLLGNGVCAEVHQRTHAVTKKQKQHHAAAASW